MDLSSRNIFTQEQLAGIGALLMSVDKRPQVMTYLYEKYRIRLENMIHDSQELLVPDSLTAEDGDVIYTELMALFR